MTDAENNGARPAVADIHAAYHHLYDSGQTLTKIKDAALGGRLFDNLEDSAGVPGRSLAWKIFLVPPQPLEPPPELPPQSHTYLESLRVSRDEFTRLLLEKMRAPDGKYEDGFIVPGTDAPPHHTGDGAGNLERNNPLSLHDQNPWNEWFAAVDLRKTILQDVERTFPDIRYFRSPTVQAQLTNILFLYSVMHPAIGYRQGMHELLAPLYHAVDFDSLPTSQSVHAHAEEEEIYEMCARRWVAADAWVLFSHVMGAAGKWYEWREDREPGLGAGASSGALGQLSRPESHSYVAPILQACTKVQRDMLKRVDPTLWGRLENTGVEPQIFGIRWLRLLFTREFNMHDAMIIWDGLFAADPSLDLSLWICVAMLVRIRNRLIPSDYSAQLTYLLRYPTPPVTVSQTTPSTHHCTLLLHQALTLQMSPTTSTGAGVVLENRNILNITIEVPDPPALSTRRLGRPGDAQRRRKSMSAPGHDEPGAGPSRLPRTYSRSSASQLGLPEMIAKNIYDRGEALGINKTIFNAVSELKRNLPDLAANLGRTPPAQSASYAAYPLLDDRPVEERPPWEPRTRFEIERDIVDLRAVQKKLGESVSWIVDTLLLDEGETEERAKQVKARKREALESLAYVRDVLVGGITDVEEERLVGEDEFKLRKERERLERVQKENAQGLPGPGITASMSPPPPAPPPVASVIAPRPLARPTVEIDISGSPRPPRHDLKTASPVSTTTTKSASMRGPWNYTRSDFSGSGGFSASVASLAPPPRASVTGMSNGAGSSPNYSPTPSYPPAPRPPSVPQENRNGPPTMSRAQHDPLGVLP